MTWTAIATDNELAAIAADETIERDRRSQAKRELARRREEIDPGPYCPQCEHKSTGRPTPTRYGALHQCPICEIRWIP